MPNNLYKPITSTISTRKEDSVFKTLNGSILNYTLCDRTDGTSKLVNYFSSFNLPATYNIFAPGSSSTLAYSNPELVQLNMDLIVIVPIPKEYYSEIIDGRSVTITVPQRSGVSSMSAKTVVSSTYGVLSKTSDSSLLGSNIAFLFSDNINLPYTGKTDGGTVNRNQIKTWNPTNYLNRPYAISYTDLAKPTDINTDKRPWASVNKAIDVGENYPTNSDQGYNYDIPVGFIALDKGFIVYTHPSIVNNIPWHLGQQAVTNNLNPTSGTTDIYFSSSTFSEATFMDISIGYKTNVICLAYPQEFYFTTNPTWDFEYNLAEFENQTNGFQNVFITEVGLYNIKQELIAVAKLSQPYEKSYTNMFNFNLDIDV